MAGAGATIEAAAPPARKPSSRARFAAAAIGLAAAASIFTPVATGLARQWYDDPNAAYGLVVAFAAVIAAHQRWPRLRRLPLTGSGAGAFALIASSGLYVVGTLAADVFLLRLSMLAIAVSTLWMVCGSAHVRLLAAPLLLLLIAIPLPSAVMTELTMPLQLAASRCAAWLLETGGVSVVRAGNVLTLNYITLEVAEACSGMRSIVTLVALVAVYGAMSGARVRSLLVLAAAAVPVAVLGNGMRVAFTAVLAGSIGENAVKGLVHDATGWAAFVVMSAALAGIHAIGSRRSQGEAAA